MKYSELCEIYEKLEGTSKRLEKTEILSEFLKKLKKEKNKEIIYLLRGSVFPDWCEKKIGISSQLTIKSLTKATGISPSEITNLWKKIGDLGRVAEQVIRHKKQITFGSIKLTTEKVLENIKKVSEFEGKGTVEKKLSLITELLSSASPIEARYIIRTLLGQLRIGVAEGTLRDSIVWACFNKADKKAYDAVQESYDKATDFVIVFENACKGLKNLAGIVLHPGQPIKVMLAQKVKEIPEAFKTVGEPAAIEFKYDGFRLLINKDETGRIKLFTRRLDEVTTQFPDVVEYAKKYVRGKTFILDSEAVGYDAKTKAYKPFQAISQRIRRKYHIEKLEKELPIEINVFDIVYHNGRNLIKEPFKERRKLLKKIIKQEKWKFKLAEQIITKSEKEAQEFYKKALNLGEEGVMFKNLEAPYKPGSRVGYMIKLKPEERDFDLVIVGAEYGTGKRSGWLSSFILACRDKNKFLKIGKVGTGIKEKEQEKSGGISFSQLTKMLRPLITEEKGRQVKIKPKIVASITFQEIQKSPTYSSGYALRFPRLTTLRPDRKPGDITTLNEIEKDYKKQER